MAAQQRRRRPAPHESGARSGGHAAGGDGQSQNDLRERLLQMQAVQASGQDPLSVFGGAAVQQAVGIDGPLPENGGAQPTFTKRVRDRHADRIGNASYDPGRYRQSIERLQEIYEANRERYASVGESSNLPPELIAALHFRESSGDFGTYLHQGDPLGRPPVNHPRDIPTFHEWEPAAQHALGDPYKKRIQNDLGIEKDTTDLASIAAYAEYYNGMGYAQRGRNSPYVYAGTDQYQGGKYVADGRYDSRAWDQQPGVLLMFQALRGEQVTDGTPIYEHQLGDRVLRRGSRGRDVRSMQEILKVLGHYSGAIDGDFGPGTEASVQAFQRAAGLDADGIVGPGTSDALKEQMPAE